MGKPHGDFKRFRKSQNFNPIAQDIAADIKRVLNHCSRVENGFEILDIDSLITEYAGGLRISTIRLLRRCAREGG